ncbi:MAG: AraC family ligand binding domain-containing protein, partial [Bacillales bacterium]|nr:AraC family ligand binding domain-containing protein [Bacillales bacterium]
METRDIESFFELYINDKRFNVDLSVYECGWERCAPSHHFGPTKRNYYIFHFIFGGKGVYKVNNQLFEVGENQIFNIYPNEIHQYTASFEEPWEYFWIGFNGVEVPQIIKEIFKENKYVVSVL